MRPINCFTGEQQEALFCYMLQCVTQISKLHLLYFCCNGRCFETAETYFVKCLSASRKPVVSCLQLYIFKKCLCPLPLMSNSFSDYDWLFQGGASLLALDDTHLLQVFIFTSWSSPPVTTRAGWAAREAGALLQGLPTAWFMIALSAMANRERHLFVSLGTTLCNVLDVCHQLAQAAAC